MHKIERGDKHDPGPYNPQFDWCMKFQIKLINK